jgi:hypothetical protein
MQWATSKGPRCFLASEMVRKKLRAALSSLMSAHPKGMWQKKRVVFAMCTLIFVWHEDD